MKFKKVEVQGFRAYGDKEDATFDFTINNEDVADLISIFAPNGFGKTSFYDAIEWTITNKIKRIENALENYDLIKTEKDANREGNQQSDPVHIISKKGYKNPEKFISIETTKKKFFRKINKTNRKGTVDYDRKAILENSNFRDVILSQEGISSFLVAEKPEDRYKNFIQHFDNDDLDRVYRNFVALRKENEKRLKALQTDKKKIKKILDQKIDLEVFEKINKLIIELDSLEFTLNKISQDFDLPDIAIFKSDITGVKNEIELGETSILEKLRSERSILINIQKSIPKFKNNTKEKENLIVAFKSITETIKKFDNLSKVNNEKDKLLAELKQSKNKVDDFVFLLEKFSDYENSSKKLNQINDNHRQKKSYLVKLNNLERLINLNLKVFEDRKKDSLKEITKIEESINTQKTNIKNYEDTIQQIAKTEKIIKPKKEALKKEEVTLGQLKKENEEILLFEKNINSGIYDQSNTNQINNELIDLIRNNKILISEKEKEINLVKKTLNDSVSLQENLSYLIELGKKIVESTEQSDCPLCKNEHGDYKNLLTKISLNNILKESSKENTNRLNQLESDLKKIKKEQEDKVEALNKVIIKKIEELQTKINKSINNVETLIKDINELEKSLEQQKQLEDKYKKENQKFSYEKKLLDLKQETKSLRNKTLYYEKIISKYSSWINNIKEKYLEFGVIILGLDKDLLKTMENPIYKKYQGLIGAYEFKPIKQEIETIFLTSKKEVESINKSISDLNEKIDLLKKDLKEFNIEDLKKDKAKSQKVLLELNLFESEFKDLIEKFDISLNNIDKDLEVKIDNNKNAINKSEDALRVLSKVEKLIEPLGRYLNYNQLKKEDSDLDKEIEINNKIDKALLKELKNTSDKIDLMINNFFFDDLINKIYAKIDPHPEYKEIKFDVDFGDYGSPKLNIFTQNDIEIGKRVPNLYFSTAQMNVLSLSIFLAKALHAIDEKGNSIDTIFIDDPVQSMDNINVLSVIDLLRNIITNQKKQIVISTHDENFFNLLKKKVPSSHFKSKFLELETFGKLRKKGKQGMLPNIIVEKKGKDKNDSDEMLMA